MPILTEPNLSVRGKREDLADMISMVDAKDTPFTSMARKGSKPGNMYFRWQADSNPAPKIGGTVDGTDVQSTDYTNFDVGYRAELANYAQVFRMDPVRVSKLSTDIAQVAGVRDELAYNVSKSILQCKRSIETTLCSNQTAQQDNGSVPYLTAGIQTWISTAGTGTPTPGDIPSIFRTPTDSILTGASSSMTDTAVQGLLKSIYNQTGQYRSYDAIVGTDLKRAFTGLLGTTALTTTSTSGVLAAGATKVQTFQRDASADAYIQSVDVFQGDFGTVKLHPTVFLGTISGGAWTVTPYKGLVLNMDLIEVRYGGNVAAVEALPSFGGGPARLVEAVCGLVVGNPLGLGKFDFSS